MFNNCLTTSPWFGMEPRTLEVGNGCLIHNVTMSHCKFFRKFILFLVVGRQCEYKLIKEYRFDKSKIRAGYNEVSTAKDK